MKRIAPWDLIVVLGKNIQVSGGSSCIPQIVSGFSTSNKKTQTLIFELSIHISHRRPPNMVDSILSYTPSEHEDFYCVLGCDESSNVEQILAEYKIRALKAHPDKNLEDGSTADESFKKLQRAKEILTDPEKRADYDKWRRSGMAIPYDQWSNLNGSIQMTMHWAAKKQTTPSLEGPASIDLKEAVKSVYGSSPKSYMVGNVVWHREQGNDLLTKFRNYEI